MDLCFPAFGLLITTLVRQCSQHRLWKDYWPSRLNRPHNRTSRCLLFSERHCALCSHAVVNQQDWRRHMKKDHDAEWQSAQAGISSILDRIELSRPCKFLQSCLHEDPTAPHHQVPPAPSALFPAKPCPIPRQRCGRLPYLRNFVSRALLPQNTGCDTRRCPPKRTSSTTVRHPAYRGKHASPRRNTRSCLRLRPCFLGPLTKRIRTRRGPCMVRLSVFPPE